MILLVALAAGALTALWYVGALTPARLRWVGLATAAVIMIRLAMTGQMLGAAAIGAGLAWQVLASRPRKRAAMSVEDARQLLGVAPDASAAEVNIAWRRRITEVHPDKGGTTDASARVNAARDTLLKHLRTMDR